MNGKDPLVGKIFGAYRITEKIAQGGMAAVYRGIDRRVGRDVAIKLVIGGKQYSDVFLKRFQREVKTLGKMMHPHIVPLLDFGSLHGVPFLVMPYLAGGTLQDDIGRGKVWDWYSAAQIILPIARALGYAHDKGIVHRDVKPANILLTDSGEPMLTDFGLMKVLSSEESMDLTGSGMVGTPDYMAPEQWVGETVPQTDMYALGIIMYVMLTGHLPYKAETAPEIMFKHISEPHLLARKLVPEIPPEIEQFVERALRKDHKKRFSSMQEFAIELEQICIALHGVPQLSKSFHPMNPLKNRAKARLRWMALEHTLHRLPLWAWAAMGCGVLALLSTLILLSIQQNRQQLNTQANTDMTKVAETFISPDHNSAYIPVNATDEPDTGTDETNSENADSGMKEDENGGEELSLLDVGSSRISQNDGMEQLYIPAGAFMMGAVEGDAGAEADEFPTHEVFLDAYWMDKTEITNKMYGECVAAGICQAPNKSSSYTRSTYFGNPDYDDYPVVHVSWYMAYQYCEWAGRRLPSEAEWEKAAGSSVAFGRYPWGNQLDCSLANYYNVSGGCGADTVAVDAFPDSASRYGVLGLAGNVWEWVFDWYQADYYEVSPLDEPFGPEEGAYKTTRGGSFNYEGNLLRTTNRGLGAPGNSNYNGGFRCVQDAE